MKQILCLLLSGLLLLSCTACADWDELSVDPLQELSQYYQSENESPAATEITSFALPYYRGETLDGVTCSDGIQQVVGALVYEGLFALDETFEPKNVLAESYQYDSTYCAYTIQLRSDVTFSDGSPLTAWDVAETLRRATTSTRYKNRLSQVDSIEAMGNSVIIFLKEAHGSFIRLLDIPIVKSGTETDNFPLGTGAYAVAKDDTGNYLAPNPNWWQNKRLPLTRIDLVPCKNTESANYSFIAQNVQLLCADLIGIDAAPADVSGTYTDAPGTVMQYLGFNGRNELLARSAVRRAISAAMDRSALINSYLLGHCRPAQFPIAPESSLYPKALETAYSQEAANDAMEEAGLCTGTQQYPLRLLVNEENHFKCAAAEGIARSLNQYDLDVTVVALPWDAYLNALEQREFDLYYGEMRLSADWNSMSLIGCGGSKNYGELGNVILDEELQSMLAADNDQQRSLAMLQFCQEFQYSQFIAPICFKSVSVLVTKGAVDQITPTAANPFYGLENWTVHLAES